MARVVDITDKLKFEEKPRLRVKGVEIEINNKATDVLEITPTLQKKDNITTEDIYHLFVENLVVCRNDYGLFMDA